MASISSVIYIGFTSDLRKRVWEHQHDIVEGFCKKYRCHSLVYYEVGDGREGVLAREKQIKKWRREKKVHLIEIMNPEWNNLTDQINQ